MANFIFMEMYTGRTDCKRFSYSTNTHTFKDNTRNMSYIEFTVKVCFISIFNLKCPNLFQLFDCNRLSVTRLRSESELWEGNGKLYHSEEKKHCL